MAVSVPVQFDARALVNDAVGFFSREFDVIISDSVRNELISRALPYQEQVTKELADGSITIDFLRGTLVSVLRSARNIMVDNATSEIGIDEIQKSMERNCPYLFWC